jgi:hypothetical protein
MFSTMIPVRVVFGGLYLQYKSHPEPHILRQRYQIRSQRLYQRRTRMSGRPVRASDCAMASDFCRTGINHAFRGISTTHQSKIVCRFSDGTRHSFGPIISRPMTFLVRLGCILKYAKTKMVMPKLHSRTHSSAHPTTYAICHYD